MTTIGTNPDCPGGIQLLADHLDTALAVGEDLLAMVLPPRADLDDADPETAPEAIDLFVRRTAELEMALLVRVLQARRRAGELGRVDASLKAAAGLFRAQSALLVELIEGADRRHPNGLGGTGDGLSYLRSRGLLAPESAAPSPYESIVVNEDFRIGGIAALGTLLDLISSLLDLLDLRFGLYAVLPDDILVDTVVAGTDEKPGNPDTDVREPDSFAETAPPPAPAVVDAREQPTDDAQAVEMATIPVATAAEPPVDPMPESLSSRLNVCKPAEMEQPA